MIKVRATCGIGFAGAEHEEEFEFENDCTEDEINQEIWDWAEQLLDVNWDVVEEDENEDEEDEEDNEDF